jgi:hypothetical protein
MKKIVVAVLVSLALSAPSFAYSNGDFAYHALPVAMAGTGLIIAGSWTKFIMDGGLGGEGYFVCVDKGCLRWPEMTADYLTAGALVVSAWGLYNQNSWGKGAAIASLGALAYLSLRNMGSALMFEDNPDKVIPDMLPLTFSLVASGFCIGIMLQQ